MLHRRYSHLRALVCTLLITGALYVGFAYFWSDVVQSDSFINDAPSGAYQYAAMSNSDKTAEIEVAFDVNDASAIERYLQANNDRAHALLGSEAGKRLWTTITFAKPLSLEVMQSLLQETQTEPESYTMVGKDGTGQKMTLTIFTGNDPNFDVEKAMLEATSNDPQAPDYNARLAGFMVVTGHIQISNQGLGKLLSDNRVYLVDTTAYEVMELSNVESANVRLPTPFWNMSWDVESTNRNTFLPVITK